MKKFNKFGVLAFSALALFVGGGLASCKKSIAGDYTYVGFNSLINQEEDWKLKVDDKNAYTLSLQNDFINAKNYGTVSKNDDGTYTLKHTGSADSAYPYPTIVYGFKAVDAAGTDWRCTGKFDFDKKTFTPIVA
jgi:hypothetical protein